MVTRNIHAEIVKDGARVNIVNLTPHEISFIFENGSVFKVAPSGVVARVSSSSEEVGQICISTFGLRIPIKKTVYGEVEGLPDPKEGTIFIVSSLVAQRVPERKDVFTLSRDEKGRIVGCNSFGHI